MADRGSIAALKLQIATLADNDRGDITATDLRGVLDDIADTLNALITPVVPDKLGRKYAAVGADGAFDASDMVGGNTNELDTITPPIAGAASFLAFASRYQLEAISRTGSPFLHLFVPGRLVIVGINYHTYISRAALPAAIINGEWTLTEAPRD